MSYSYYRNRGYSTDEMLSEGKIDLMDLPMREPFKQLTDEDHISPSTLALWEQQDRELAAMEKEPSDEPIRDPSYYDDF